MGDMARAKLVWVEDFLACGESQVASSDCTVLVGPVPPGFGLGRGVTH